MDQQRTVASPLSPRRGKRVRLAVAILATIVVVAVGVLVYRYIAPLYALRQAEAELLAALGEVNAAEPNGWQLQDLENRRDKIADDQNSSRIVIAASKLLPDAQWKDARIIDEITGLPPPAQLTEHQTEALRTVVKKLEASLQKGRNLVDYPRGRFPPVVWSRDIVSTRPAHLGDVRDVGAALHCDAFLHCQERQYVMAWTSALAVLNAGRSIGDEPYETSQFAREAMQEFAVRAMERILGHGELNADHLQIAAAVLRDEVDSDLAILGIRGERALQHAFFSKVENGELNLSDVTGWREEMQREWENADDTARRTMLVSAHAYELRLATGAAACAGKPDSERDECQFKWRQAQIEREKRGRVPWLAAALSQRFSIGSAEVMLDSRMECAITALAAERFRLQRKRWPNDLNELVAAMLLPKVPTDLYGGQPMQYRVSDDGVVVWAGGHFYAGNAWDDLTTPPRRSFTRKEFRLWNPDRRAQPPVPARVENER